jgi:hypothetical protein
VPAWVTDLDPDFVKHGGSASRVELVDLRYESTEGLFEVPRHYRLVKPFDLLN